MSNAPLFQLGENASWEPMDFADVLDQDGVYCGRITKEVVKTEDDKPGVWLTFTLEDSDVAGKNLQKKLGFDAKQEFLWRGLIRSVTGDMRQAKGAFSYVPGQLTNLVTYFKVESYENAKDGERRSGLGSFLTKAEYDEAVAKGRHRWPAEVKGRGGSKGGTPAGLPSAFPGFPGAAASVPQPAAAQPLNPAPVPQTMAPANTPTPTPPQPNGFAAPAAGFPAPAPGGFPGFPGVKK